MNRKDKIYEYPYITGSDFTERVRDLIGAKSYSDMATATGYKKTTISTWNSHNRISHELAVRVHLRLGIPIRELVLPDDFPLEELAPEARSSNKTDNKNADDLNPQLQTITLKSYCLSNGKLLDTGDIPYPMRRIRSFNLESSDLIEIETNDGLFLIDKDQSDPVSGEYLIDMNGRMSINHIQCLPNKLAVAFGNNTLEISEEDIKVIGRVAMSMRKE